MHKFPIQQALTYQAAVWLVMSVLVTTAFGLVKGYSATLGGLISLLPGTYFMLRYFRYSGATKMDAIVRNAYSAELVKLVLIGFGFASVFLLVKPLSPGVMFGGFLAVQASNVYITYRLAGRKQA